MVGNQSRYAHVPVYKVKRADGITITVYDRRFPIKPAKTISVALTNTNRIDLMGYDNYQDCGKYWAISDCNVALSPFDLLTNRSNTVIVPSPNDVKSYI
jgi:hypothetical protein